MKCEACHVSAAQHELIDNLCHRCTWSKLKACELAKAHIEDRLTQAYATLKQIHKQINDSITF